MWYEGLAQATWWQVLLYVLVTTHLTIVSVTLYLHRHSAHRALDLHPALAHVFRFILYLTTGMVTKEWTAIHRKHHACCETADDPHSPQVHGLPKVLFEGADLYRIEAANAETLARFGTGTPDDWMERNVYSRHQSLGVTALLLIDVALFGAIGLTVWAVQMMWIPFWAAGVINGVGHYFGYRNFECPDASTNISPVGILIGGEELHNNHHTYPNSAKFSVRPWEFDIGWFYIRVLSALGLARPLSRGPVAVRDPAKSAIDMDTVWAAMNDRFRIMARYTDTVIAPAVAAERARIGDAGRAVLRRARQLLSRNDLLVDERARRRISEVTEASPLLRRCYELRLSLQAVWAKRGGNRDELLEAFHAWCRDAEESGIRTLQQFAVELRSYTVPPTMARP
jgi:fatty-acid desaturase